MTTVEVLLVAFWLLVAIALAIGFGKHDTEGCLAYRATGDRAFHFLGSLTTMLFWPILLPLALFLWAVGVRSSDL